MTDKITGKKQAADVISDTPHDLGGRHDHQRPGCRRLAAAEDEAW
jgi:hypothetical protein